MNLIRTALVASALACATSLACGQAAPKLKVGLMLPAIGTFAALGTAIDNGFRLYAAEHGGKLGPALGPPPHPT